MSTVDKQQILESVESGILILAIEGCLDHNLSIKLSKLAQPTVKQSGAKILIDLEPTMFIGSMGFTVLVELIETAKEKGSRVELCNLHGVAQESFQIMGFEGLEIASESREKALERFLAG